MARPHGDPVRRALRARGRDRIDLLPADGANEQREVESLRRELEAAQKQGEAYGRARRGFHLFQPPQRAFRPSAGSNRFAECPFGHGFQHGSAAPGYFSSLERELAQLRNKAPAGETISPSDAVLQQMALGSELVADLTKLAHCPVHELPQSIEVVELVRRIMGEMEPRAARRGVAVRYIGPDALTVESRPGPLSLLVRTLLSDATLASPRSTTIVVELGDKQRAPR